ncbi:hypothetical protein L207DRAFT_507249 [Hyaloscypha variabilis F]|uniref:Extracellular membrane protein CFEM domain-containing protein n=1 Tax=Hyaloscypha variabilis (strain UAMH 11265 / GT02V1 / F) TaxID=1149755 RepID=A0A2J6S6E0_HYAVF|nr:hypothetical protein L207DRAFT_507249 [Hyaloscypha variabilis F]
MPMGLLTFLVLTLSSLALAASTTSTLASVSESAAATTTTDDSPEYSITALPAVVSAPACVFNCLFPGALNDPVGCDNVTNNCACLSAPANAIDFITGCIETVCASSTSAYAASATSLYESYCDSIYGTATFSEAFVEEASAAAMSSSLASVEATQSSSTIHPSTTSSGSASASPTKSDAERWQPALYFGTIAVGGLLILAVL